MDITNSNYRYHYFELVISIIRISDFHKWVDLVIYIIRINEIKKSN